MELEKAYNIINKTIKKGKSEISAVLVEKLASKLHISKDNAIHRISYMVKKGQIFSSAPLRFMNGQYAYSLENKNNNFWNSVMKYKETLYSVLIAFKNNGKIISYLEIGKLSGCLFNDNIKYLTIDKIIEEIRYFYEISIVEIDGNDFVVGKKKIDDYSSEYEELKLINHINCVFMPAILKYLQDINMIGAKPIYRNRNNPFFGINTNNLMFDMVAFSQTTGLVQSQEVNTENGLNKSLVLFDVKLDSCYTMNDYIGFRARVNCIINATKSKIKRRVLPIIVVDKIDSAVIDHIKKDGYLVLQFSKLFGENGVKLLDIFRKNAKLSFDEAEEILSAVEQSGHKDMLISIKGFIFEMLVERILRKMCDHKNYKYNLGEEIKNEIEDVNTGKTSDKRAELDIVVKEHNDNRIIFECKSSVKPIYWRNFKNNQLKDSSYANYFFRRTAGILDKYYGKDKYKMCMISANGFNGETKSNLSKNGFLSKKHEDFELAYSIEEFMIHADRIMIEYKSNENIKKEKKIIKKFFISTGVEEIVK